MTPNDVTEVLRQLVLATTPLDQAISEWPNAPRPSTSYATLGINFIEQVNHSDYVDTDNVNGDVDRTHNNLFDISIGVNFFLPDSMLNAALFSSGLIRHESTQLLNASNVGLVSRSNIRDLTLVFNSEFEDRAQIDIVLQAVITLPNEQIPAIDTVHIVGNIHNKMGLIDQIEIIGNP